mmetsp:Transcript_2706/g.7941  ORF Transcript_2706/g.7941 Transcript_2706/m.7941 type:complete len:98 (+) Transcript_2706:88-381(+)
MVAPPQRQPGVHLFHRRLQRRGSPAPHQAMPGPQGQPELRPRRELYAPGHHVLVRRWRTGAFARPKLRDGGAERITNLQVAVRSVNETSRGCERLLS